MDIVINGKGFSDKKNKKNANKVYFGDDQASDVEVISDTQLKCKVPKSNNGKKSTKVKVSVNDD